MSILHPQKTRVQWRASEFHEQQHEVVAEDKTEVHVGHCLKSGNSNDEVAYDLPVGSDSEVPISVKALIELVTRMRVFKHGWVNVRRSVTAAEVF